MESQLPQITPSLSESVVGQPALVAKPSMAKSSEKIEKSFVETLVVLEETNQVFQDAAAHPANRTYNPLKDVRDMPMRRSDEDVHDLQEQNLREAGLEARSELVNVSKAVRQTRRAESLEIQLSDEDVHDLQEQNVREAGSQSKSELVDVSNTVRQAIRDTRDVPAVVPQVLEEDVHEAMIAPARQEYEVPAVVSQSLGDEMRSELVGPPSVAERIKMLAEKVKARQEAAEARHIERHAYRRL